MFGIAPYRQPVLIYNPTAGKLQRDAERILQRTTEVLTRANISPELLPTRGPGDATVRAKEAVERGADLILVFGGDGTVNEVVNGLAHTQVPLGVLPGGTANCLAIELELGTRIERAAERIASYVPHEVALGRICSSDGYSRYFLLMCGVGLDARIVYDVQPALKKAAGKLAYWVAGLSQFAGSIEQLEARIHGQTFRCGFLLASRIRNYGGDMEIATGASLVKDEFEFVIFEGDNPMRYALYMLGVAVRQVGKMRGVTVLHGQRAEILTPAHTQIDGEYAGPRRTVIEIVPKGLTLLLPPTLSASS